MSGPVNWLVATTGGHMVFNVCIADVRGSIVIVPKKKKPKKFSATSAVKAASRAVLRAPPPVKRAENKKLAKKDKHKPSLGKLLADADRG
jgi:hypothetical protein